MLYLYLYDMLVGSGNSMSRRPVQADRGWSVIGRHGTFYVLNPKGFGLDFIPIWPWDTEKY